MRKKNLPRGLYWHSRTASIWCRFWVRGREYRRSCRTTDPRSAEVEARRIKVEVEQASPDLGPGRTTLVEMSAADIADHRRRGVGELHRGKLDTLWLTILRNFDDGLIAVDSISYDALRDYEGRRRAGSSGFDADGEPWRNRPARGQTIVRELAAIRRALLIAVRRGHLAMLPDPWPKVRRDPKDRRRAGKLWPPELLSQWLTGLHQDARDEVEFALRTGLRAAETKRVEAGWVEPAPHGSPTPSLLRVPDWAAKSRRERIIGLTAAAHAIVKRRVEAEPRVAQVFASCNFKKHRAAVARRLGFPTAPTLRDLRHTFATLALAATGDAAGTMDALGHTDLRTTAIYQSSTLARTAAAAAGVDRVLGPEHPDRSTQTETSVDLPIDALKVERAKRLELSTLSLGSADTSRKWLQLLAADVEAERLRTAENVSRPEHITGARVTHDKRRGGL